jgi:hypothetical protein
VDSWQLEQGPNQPDAFVAYIRGDAVKDRCQGACEYLFFVLHYLQVAVV